VLVFAYVAAVGVIWNRERRPPAIGEMAEVQEELEEADHAPTTRAVLLVLGGVALMVGGGWLAVSGAERVAQSLGFADSTVGLTFVALATTAELFALVIAAYRRGIAELALAGILGSALYNATATLGVAALVHPIPASGLIGPAWVAAALPLFLVAYAQVVGRIERAAGMALTLCYGGYLALTLR
jgi:cation:H+ antiporter